MGNVVVSPKQPMKKAAACISISRHGGGLSNRGDETDVHLSLRESGEV